MRNAPANGRTGRLFDAKLQAVVQFADMSLSENPSAEECAIAQRLMNEILSHTGSLNQSFGFIPACDMRATPDGPVVSLQPRALQAAVRALIDDLIDDRRVDNPGDRPRPVFTRSASVLTIRLGVT